MSLLSEINNAAKNPEMTHPQGKMLFLMTGLMFWQPESLPKPSKEQASLLISAIKTWIDEKTGDPAEIIEAIQMWFPSFTDISKIHWRRAGSKKSSVNQQKDNENDRFQAKNRESLPEKPTTQYPKPDKPDERVQTPSATPPKREAKPPKTEKQEQKPEVENSKSEGLTSIKALIEADIKNIWIVGPAGCGKTTICQLIADELDIPVTIVPCGAGTSATTFLGYKYPEREGTPFVHAFGQEGIIVLDEFSSLEAQVAQIVNGALANNELTATTGTIHRHENCVIIATSNTFGKGGDRQYVANQQLDASTIDRFACGIVEIDYSHEYESQFDTEVVKYVQRLREIIKLNGFREIVSTRSIISGCKLKNAGLDWKSSITTNWTKDEKACIR